jgi:hypothetical protein
MDEDPSIKSADRQARQVKGKEGTTVSKLEVSEGFNGRKTQ